MNTCNTCRCDKVCNHEWYGFETCNNYIPAENLIQKTNFDRIKAMSVEEMAEYFALDKHPSTPCYVCEYDNGLFCSKEDCNPDYKIKAFKEYLESEVQEDE